MFSCVLSLVLSPAVEHGQQQTNIQPSPILKEISHSNHIGQSHPAQPIVEKTKLICFGTSVFRLLFHPLCFFSVVILSVAPHLFSSIYNLLAFNLLLLSSSPSPSSSLLLLLLLLLLFLLLLLYCTFMTLVYYS